MKRCKLIGALIAATVLTGLGNAGFAMAQTFSSMKQGLLSSSNETEFKMDEITPAQEAQEWQEMKQRFIDAGINLTPQQESTIRQAVNQLRAEMRPVFQDNPLATFAQLIAAATLPEPQGEALMRTTGLDQRLGTPLLAYRNRVLNALTPEQRPIWESQIWQGGDRPQSENPATDNPLQMTTADPDLAEQDRFWEKTKQRFREAGVPLTPQQEAQIQAADAKLQAELTQEFQTNPVGTFARFAAFAMLPASITERIASDLLGQAVITNLQTVDQILTPEQRQIWEHRFSNLNQG
jgi:Spy/CpxP family protein refolding chaperone